MSFRDDLAAAHARIRALEAQLAESTEDAAQRAPEVASLAATVEELRAKLEEARARLQAHDDAAARAAQGRSMWTLFEHNALAPPLSRPRNTEPSGVLCPRCLERDAVPFEMLAAEHSVTSSGIDEVTVAVTCPRCLFVGLKRTAV
jgi:hypothetical protein